MTEIHFLHGFANEKVTVTRRFYVEKYSSCKIIRTLFKELRLLTISNQEVRVLGTVEKKSRNKCEENFSSSNSSRSIAVSVSCSTSADPRFTRLFSESRVFVVYFHKVCTKSTVYFVYFIHRRSHVHRKWHRKFS